jgi:hypothetical protein
MSRKLLKAFLIVAFSLALISLFYGLYLFQTNPDKGEQKPHVSKDVVYLDRQGNVINRIKKQTNTLCSSNRWRKLEIIDANKKQLFDNKVLFTQFNSEIEIQGRHKNQQTIPLNQLFSEFNSLNIVACDGTELSFSERQVADSNIRLVLNSKGGLKLLQNEDNKIKVVAKYLLSISKNNNQSQL